MYLAKALQCPQASSARRTITRYSNPSKHEVLEETLLVASSTSLVNQTSSGNSIFYRGAFTSCEMTGGLESPITNVFIGYSRFQIRPEGLYPCPFEDESAAPLPQRPCAAGDHRLAGHHAVFHRYTTVPQYLSLIRILSANVFTRALDRDDFKREYEPSSKQINLTTQHSKEDLVARYQKCSTTNIRGSHKPSGRFI